MNLKFLFIISISFFSFSRDKIAVKKCQPPATISPKKAIAKKWQWTGTFSNLEQAIKTIPNSFISNGIAKLTGSPFYYYWTSMELPIPADMNMDGDHLKFEIRTRNPVSEGAIEELDLTLYITGENGNASVSFIGRKHRQQFTSIMGAKTVQKDIPELIQLFQEWNTVSLITSGTKVAALKNGTEIKSISYSGNIGRVKKISISFKGIGSVDWVHLYNSKTGKGIIREEFDREKKAHVQKL